MSEPRKANRYAMAILEAVLDLWESSLNEVMDAVAQKSNVRSTLESATADVDAKLKALQSAMPKGTPIEVQNFLKLLVQEGDLNLVPAVLSELRTGVTGQGEPQKAEIVSAVELSDKEQAEIRQGLTAEHGEGLIFSFRVDPSLMGGLRVRVGDTLIDNTVASRLAAMREIVSASVR
ncbi:MAG: ATP synthase F1 subunit delta [Caldilineaceae bacterium]